MPPLSRKQIRVHQEWLYEWRAPNEMLEYVEDVNSRTGRYFLIQAGLEFLRNAWSAATFARIRTAAGVRLVNGEWPDFELKVGDDIESFECTEADVPGRRRGEEYQEAEKRAGSDGIALESDPVDDWIARARIAPKAIKKAAEKKAAKAYPANTRLLIYLNINEFGIRQDEIERSFLESTAPAKNSFKEVWVLWKHKAYKIWANALPS